jgi:hypothetical protein
MELGNFSDSELPYDSRESGARRVFGREGDSVWDPSYFTPQWWNWRSTNGPICLYSVSSDISCARSTLSSPLLTLKLPLYLMKPSFLNLFMK